MNRVKNLNQQSNLLLNDEELVSLNNEVTLNSLVSSSTSYKDNSSNLDE